MHMIVAGPTDPDLDGLACSYAYAEFLRSKGHDAQCVVYGNPREEAAFAAKKFRIRFMRNLDASGKKVVLVDTSVLARVSRKIDPNDVIEVIDHRKLNTAGEFKNAKLQLEFIGAAATMVAEKFMKGNADISRESASLLLLAIISNTINFRNNVTTQRDRKAARWLEARARVEKNYVRNFFLQKSRIGNLALEIKRDGGIFSLGGMKIYIAQLEMLDGEKFVRKNGAEILRILKSMEKKNSLEHSFLKVIDVGLGNNVFYTQSSAVMRALEDVAGAKFSGPIGKSRGIIMRKELAPLLDEYFRK